jgi:hypothetical protein
MRLVDAQSVEVILGIALLVFVFFVWIPWVGKLLSLYGLHGLRERVYRAARAYPEARQTSLYRDVEMALSVFIYVVRDCSVGSVVMLVGAIVKAQDEHAQQGHRSAQYDRERDHEFRGPLGHRALDEILQTASPVSRFLLIRLATANPLFQAIGVVLALVALLERPMRWLTSAESQTQRIARRVVSTERFVLKRHAVTSHGSGRSRVAA